MTNTDHHTVVSDEEWLEARRSLLREEKQALKQRDEFTKRQRALPWRKIEKSYVFTTTEGDVSLSELFAGRSQLFVKHFMMGPDQDWQMAKHRAVYNFTDFDPEESEDLSGNSIFYRDKDGQVFHTYSTFGRGGEQFLGIYGFFDLLPKGREENGPTHSLPDWASFRTKRSTIATARMFKVWQTERD